MKNYVKYVFACIGMICIAEFCNAQDIDSTVNKSYFQESKMYNAKDFQFQVYSEIVVSAHLRQLDKKTWNYIDSTCWVDSIKIFEKKDKKYIHTIVPEDNHYPCNADPITIEDMNFDSYDDISIMQFTGTPNDPSYYWLYNAQLKIFVRDEALENITSAEFDHANKLVKSRWSSGAGMTGVTTYRYISGKLTKIKEIEEISVHNEKTGHDYFYITIKALVDGKMKIISKKRSNEYMEL